MADTSHWIVVDGGPPYEIDQAFLIDNFYSLKTKTRLVPGRIWRDFQKRQTEMQAALAELKSYNMPELTVVAPHVPREQADVPSGDSQR